MFQDLVDAGKRVVFMSGADYSPEGDELLFVKESICDWQEPPLPFAPFPSCRFQHSNIGPLDESKTIFRPETSEIEYGFLNADGQIGKNKYLLDETSLPPLVDCGVNIPSPDNITPKRMESTIWALKRGDTLEKGKCVAITRAGASWKSVDCDAPNMVAACVDPDRSNDWRLSTTQAVEAKSVEACKQLSDEKVAYGVPASGYENKLVFSLLSLAPASVAGVWINAKDIVDDIYFSVAAQKTRSDGAGGGDAVARKEMHREHALLAVE